MQFKNTLDCYGVIAKLLHWVIALLVICLLCVGLYMVGLPAGPDQTRIIGMHKEFGLVVLLLALFRLGWRFFNVDPALPLAMSQWERYVARMVHWLLLALIIAMPLTGWLLSSAAAHSPSFFGLFQVLPLIAPDKDLAEFFAELHEWLAYSLIALLCGHVAAALKHHYIDKDSVLRRMLP